MLAAFRFGSVAFSPPASRVTERIHITIFIPAYNRAHTITRALDSVRAQTVGDWDILVIDDGSTDLTAQVVTDWSKRNAISVTLIPQHHGGKHRAHNRAVAKASGFLLMTLDSDDVLKPNALAEVTAAWLAIPDDQRARFAGIEGLCQTSDGTLHGAPFPADVIDSDHLEIAGRYGVHGEKRNAIRVDVLRRFPYPEIAGEDHIRPSFLWKQLAHHYRFRFINRVLQVVDFAEGGLTRTASTRRLRNVRGLYTYWRDDVLHHQHWLSPKTRVRHYAQYVRYGLHSGVTLRAQWQDIPDHRLWLRALLRGVPNFLADRLKGSRSRTPASR